MNCDRSADVIRVINAPKEFRRDGTVEIRFRLEAKAAPQQSQLASAIPNWPGEGFSVQVQPLPARGILLSVYRDSALPYGDAYFASLACILAMEKNLGRFVSIEESPRKLWTMQFVLAECAGAFDRFKTELMKASGGGDIEAVRSLLRSAALGEMETRSLTGHTAICYAAERGHVDIVKLLIERGAEVNPDAGEWMLAESALIGGVEILKVLLDAGLSPNTQNHYGETALMFASARGQVDALTLLLQRGAVLTLRDETGATALDWGTRGQQIEAVRVLEAAKRGEN